jgi:hypothetical protein
MPTSPSHKRDDDAKRERGRPSKYDPSFVALTEDYARNPKKYDDPVPTVEGIATECGVGKDTYLRWCSEHEDLSNAYMELKSRQARLLQKYGLLNKTNALITKLMLSANHGMSEKNGVELTGKDGGPVEQSLTVHNVIWE